MCLFTNLHSFIDWLIVEDTEGKKLKCFRNAKIMGSNPRECIDTSYIYFVCLFDCRRYWRKIIMKCSSNGKVMGSIPQKKYTLNAISHFG